jgi:thymidylate synthase
MRSNDVWRGFPLDVYQFTMWQLILAAKLGLPVGEYYHFAGSFHLYERDRDAAKKYMASDAAAVFSTLPDGSFYDALVAQDVREAMKSGDLNELKLGSAIGWVNTYWNNGSLSPEFELLRSMDCGNWSQRT